MVRSKQSVATAIFGALALAAWSASPASAETRIPYQIQAVSDCTTLTTCEVAFPVTPANRRVEIERVNCVVVASQPLDLSVLNLSTSPELFHVLPVSQVVDTSVGDHHYINEASAMFVPAGLNASVEVSTTLSSNPFRLVCSLYGELVFLP